MGWKIPRYFPELWAAYQKGEKERTGTLANHHSGPYYLGSLIKHPNFVWRFKISLWCLKRHPLINFRKFSPILRTLFGRGGGRLLIWIKFCFSNCKLFKSMLLIVGILTNICVPGKSLVKPYSRKLIPTKCPKKNSRKSIPAITNSLKVPNRYPHITLR